QIPCTGCGSGTGAYAPGKSLAGFSHAVDGELCQRPQRVVRARRDGPAFRRCRAPRVRADRYEAGEKTGDAERGIFFRFVGGHEIEPSERRADDPVSKQERVLSMAPM